MKRVAQLIDSPETGDCFRACVASILEVDPLSLPNISEPQYKDRNWLDVMSEAIEKYNLVLMQTTNKSCYWQIPYFIWSVPSPRYEGKMHAVVVNYEPDDPTREGMSAWRVVWDPSPWRDTDLDLREACYAEPFAATFFVSVHPERQVPRGLPAIGPVAGWRG